MRTDKPGQRSGCPISFSLDIIGDQWTLLVLRELVLFNRRHFRDILAMEEGIATNILSDRLKRLETFGIVRRVRDPDDGRKVIYRVTEAGIGLVPTLYDLSYWGAVNDRNTGAPTRFIGYFKRSSA